MPKDSLGEILVVETLNKIDSKLDKLDDRLDEQGKTLVKQQAILDEHVKRTNLLEDKIASDVKQVKEALPDAVQAQIKLARNKFLIQALKIAGIVVGTGAGGMGLKEVIGWILKFLE